MKHSLKIGLSFGLFSGVITTLGLMVGLNSSTGSKLVVVGGILIIAITDAFSDALGIHMSEESEIAHTSREIWEATFATWFFKFIFALTFLIPVLLFELNTAVLINIIWGLSLLSVFSFRIAKEQQINPWLAIIEHLIVAILVIIITYFVGNWIALKFK